MTPNESTSVFINQGEREATVLAVIGDHYLIEYEMPAGTTALLVMPEMRSVSYASLPVKWLRAVVEAEMDWIGNPQSRPMAYLITGSPSMPSPAEMLARKTGGK